MHVQAVLEGAVSGLDLQSADKQDILRTAKRCWLDETYDKSRKRSSFYARDIASVVTGLGKRYKEEDTSTGYAVDVSIPSMKIAIEADGPTHRCRNSNQPLGGTVMKQRHLKAAGWQLITVAHDDWDELRGRKQKLEFLQLEIDACMSSR